MSIADQITRLNNAKAAIMDSISNKGVDVPGDALLDELPALIDSIEVGSGEGNTNPIYELHFNLKTKDNTYYYELFNGYTGTELDVSSLDTTNVTNMGYMFRNCSNLEEIDLSNFTTTNVTNMNNMFNGCKGLAEIDLSNFDTTNVTNMSYMFYSCKGLAEIDVNGFDITNVTNMGSMFTNCVKLTSLDLSGWTTTNVTNMSYMFNSCTNLEELIIPNWDMTNVTSAAYKNYILGNCTSLHTIRLDNCSNDTINKIITSSNFPTDAIEGVTRTIYCKEENAVDLTVPTNWEFSYITEEE